MVKRRLRTPTNGRFNLFRVWSVDFKEHFYCLDGFHQGRYMIYRFSFNSGGISRVSVGVEEDDASDRTSYELNADRVTLEYCIGQKDCEGADLYEGDTVTYRDPVSGKTCQGFVSYNRLEDRFVVAPPDKVEEYLSKGEVYIYGTDCPVRFVQDTLRKVGTVRQGK